MKALTVKPDGKSPDIGLSTLKRPTMQPDKILVQDQGSGSLAEFVAVPDSAAAWKP
jgi:hypothetical protein